MRSVSATAAARSFSDILDAVENRGESFLVVRRGRTIARIEPAGSGRGQAVKELLRRAPRDPEWVDEVRQLRSATGIEERRWQD
jgi:antitoxin (DNA-binding transcriptional repressor) of toxin-antitoxin stability system